jgi:hypothetical protein
MTRWARIVAVVSLVALPFTTPGPARAEPCPVLGPCTVDGVDDVVDDAVDDALDTVSDTVGTASDSADHAHDTADEVLTGATDDPPPAGGQGGGHHHPRRAGDRSGGDGAPKRKTPGADPSPFILSARLAPRPGGGIEVPAVAPIGLADEGSRDRDRTDRLVATAAEVAKGIVSVLLLLGAALGFVLVQDRLDRNEPRLALAPVRSDDVRFE